MFALTDFAQAKLRSACAIKQMEAYEKKREM